MYIIDVTREQKKNVETTIPVNDSFVLANCD